MPTNSSDTLLAAVIENPVIPHPPLLKTPTTVHINEVKQMSNQAEKEWRNSNREELHNPLLINSEKQRDWQKALTRKYRRRFERASSISTNSNVSGSST